MPSETTFPPTLLMSNMFADSITSASKILITLSRNSISTLLREWERHSNNHQKISGLTNSKKSTGSLSINSWERILGLGSSQIRESPIAEDFATSDSIFSEDSLAQLPSSLGRIEIHSRNKHFLLIYLLFDQIFKKNISKSIKNFSTSIPRINKNYFLNKPFL